MTSDGVTPRDTYTCQEAGKETGSCESNFSDTGTTFTFLKMGASLFRSCLLIVADLHLFCYFNSLPFMWLCFPPEMPSYAFICLHMPFSYVCMYVCAEAGG